MRLPPAVYSLSITGSELQQQRGRTHLLIRAPCPGTQRPPAGASTLASLAPLNTLTPTASRPPSPRAWPARSVALIQVLTRVGFVFNPSAPQALPQDSAMQVGTVAPALSPGTYSAPPRLLMVLPEFTVVLGWKPDSGGGAPHTVGGWGGWGRF